jgi:hypothetical protein
MDERLICIAGFKANHDRMFPLSASEKAMEDREKRRLEVVDRKREEIMEERRGVVELTPTPEAIEARRIVEIEMAEPSEPAHQVPQDARSRYRLACTYERQLAEGQPLCPDAAAWLKRYQQHSEYRTFRAVETDLCAVQNQ